jgi:3'-phosphoadenosine 5'-phosphosulfate (PAPS) 3'-phosphatase
VPLLAEEGAATPYEERRVWKRWWCVDPLDGTRDFVAAAASSASTSASSRLDGRCWA